MARFFASLPAKNYVFTLEMRILKKSFVVKPADNIGLNTFVTTRNQESVIHSRYFY